MDYFESYREMISLRGLTGHTILSYSTYIKVYLEYVRSVLSILPEEVSWQQQRDFIRWLQKNRSLSDRTINTAISQLRFFTIYVLHKNWDPSQLPMRKFDSYLPYIPSQEETWQFISTIPDLKQKTMVAVMYSSGLRIGEVCNLRYEDISRSKMSIHIPHSKNRSDRYAELSDRALRLLTQYWREYGKPMGYLFPQKHNPDKPIDTFYLSRHIHEHEDRLGWPRRLTCHTFRHAYGTHLYENGADLLMIKEKMGHRSLNSTLIYIHLADHTKRSVKSPFDLMGGSACE